MPNIVVDTDTCTRHWSHVDPSRPELFPAVGFEEIMKNDKGVANWTKKIVQSLSTRSLPLLTNRPSFSI